MSATTARSKKILVVEDDPDLGPRLEEFLSELDSASVELRECVLGEEKGGLTALLNAIPPFDLVVVDIMLPKDEASLAKRREFEGIYDRLAVEFESLEGKPEFETRASELRGKLEEVLRAARNAIDYRGGLSMLEEFQRQRKEEARIPALLFLTANGERSTRENAERIAGKLGARFECLVKPQSVEKLRETAKRLLGI